MILTIKRVVSHYFLLLIMLTLSGCADFEAKRHLDETLLAFEKTIRWGTLDDSSSYQKEPESFTSEERKRNKNYKVTGYDVIRSSYDGEKLNQVVEIRYYSLNSAVERSLTHEFDWEYSEKNDRWELTSKLPRYK